MGKLTGKQERFCKEYASLKAGKFNASKAAIAAGYSEKTAGEMGYENLNKPQIKARIAELQQNAVNELDVNLKNVTAEIAKIGFSDEFDLEGFERLDMSNKLKALDMLARMIGAFNNDDSGKATINVSFGKKK